MPTASPPSGGVRIKEHLSLRHFRSATYLASSARAMEAENPNPPIAWTADEQVRWDKCAAYAIGATFAAVAGLEAAANELYINATSSSEEHDGIDPKLRPGLMALWPKGFNKKSGESLGEILRKYDRALEVARNVAWTVAVVPSTSEVALLIQVRNALTHSKEDFRVAAPYGPPSEWSDMERGLRVRVAPSSLTPDSAMFLWCRALGAPLAEWALATAHAYACDAYDALGAKVIFRVTT